MRFIRIVLSTSAALWLYGVIHDQITVRVSPEYFTLGHPSLVATASPTLLALAWGSATTLPAGLALGFLLAGVATNGRRRPLLGLQDLMPLLGGLILAMATVAIVSGLAGWTLSRVDAASLHGPLAEQLAPDVQQRYLAVRWAHGGAYLSGIVGSVVLVVTAWRRREARHVPSARLR